MRALFTGFLTVGISSSMMIGFVWLMRLVFKKAPKTLICIMWALVALRLLLPFQIPVNFAIRPETPVITESDVMLFEEQQTYTQEELPSFVPVQTVNASQNVVTIDYVQIGTTIWCVGVAAMLGYMLFSYLRMQHKLRESVKREDGIYENASIPTAFLLGYLRPRIYLPTKMSKDSEMLVIRHEQAHLRRGDNWLKLFAYICLAVHWYNPCVWLMYMLLGRDIESACDEMVIRQLDEQGRADYSSALLNCGKGKNRFAGCPVAFGEVSIGQRIRNVLSYKKPTLWICIVLVIVMIAGAVFLLTDPVESRLNTSNAEETLLSLIGEDKATVCSVLGVSENDLIEIAVSEINMCYQIPMTVEYYGVDFMLLLSFDGFEGYLWRIELLHEYTGVTEACAEDIVQLARKVVAEKGEPKQGPQNGWGAHTIEDGEIPELYKKIINGSYDEGYLWYLGDKAPENVKECMGQYGLDELKLLLTWNRDTERKVTPLKVSWSVGVT